MTNETIAGAATADKKKKNLKRILAVLAAIFLILLAALIYYLMTQRPIVNVVPGVTGAPRYTGSIYGEFGNATGIAVNSNGSRIYLVDSDINKVLIFNQAGKQVGSFGVTVDATSLAEEGFGAAIYAAVGSQGEVYVSDRVGARIQIYGPTGKYIKRFIPEPGSPDGFTWSPLAIATDKKGNLYVTDGKANENRVLKFDIKTGKLLLKFGKEGLGTGEFSYPNGLTVSNDGTIYVSDSNNARVQAFDAKGKFLFTVTGSGGSAFSHPVGIDATRPNEILVADSLGHIVVAIDRTGKTLYSFGKFGIGDGQFRYPQGLAVTQDGRVYVADRGNKRIQIWKY